VETLFSRSTGVQGSAPPCSSPVRSASACKNVSNISGTTRKTGNVGGQSSAAFLSFFGLKTRTSFSILATAIRAALCSSSCNGGPRKHAVGGGAPTPAKRWHKIWPSGVPEPEQVASLLPIMPPSGRSQASCVRRRPKGLTFRSSPSRRQSCGVQSIYASATAWKVSNTSSRIARATARLQRAMRSGLALCEMALMASSSPHRRSNARRIGSSAERCNGQSVPPRARAHLVVRTTEPKLLPLHPGSS